MRIIKAILGFLISRRFWVFVGLVLLAALIWIFGPLVSVGDAVPLESELARLLAKPAKRWPRRRWASRKPCSDFRWI